MRGIRQFQNKNISFKVFSIALLSMFFTAFPAKSHEIEPAIVDVTVAENELVFTIELSIEAVLAGVDLDGTTNTEGSAAEADYDALRRLTAPDLVADFSQNWASLGEKYRIFINDIQHEPELKSLIIPEVGNTDLVRISTLKISAVLPSGATSFQFGWDADLGLMVLRRSANEGGFAGYVEPGELSPVLTLDAKEAPSNLSVFVDFIPVGFDHILPKGLDHILFVFGLFLFSTKMRPLLWQVSAFTVAHTITLALASLNIVTVSAGIVEPLIALSIAYVAIENIFTSKLAIWRPALIFAFGLLHGLGFASVLSEFGLPGVGLVSALIGFNIGVELGQLVVICICFVAVGIWFGHKSWYRQRIVIPASALIALTGVWWTIERVFL